MTNRSRFMPPLASVFASAIIVASFMGVSASLTTYAQTKPDAKPSEAEAKAAMAIQAAPDAAAKLTLAEAFVKKYPKSPARPDVAGYMATRSLA